MPNGTKASNYTETAIQMSNNDPVTWDLNQRKKKKKKMYLKCQEPSKLHILHATCCQYSSAPRK